MSFPQKPVAKFVEQLPTADELRTEFARNAKERALLRQLMKLAVSVGRTAEAKSEESSDA